MKNINEFHANKLKTMLVDGDLLAYKITSALEETIQWEDDVWTLHCDLDKCKQFWKQSIAYYMKHTNSANAVIVFSDVGVSKTLSFPKVSCNPFVVPKIFFGSVAPNPKAKTVGSYLIESKKAAANKSVKLHILLALIINPLVAPKLIC